MKQAIVLNCYTCNLRHPNKSGSCPRGNVCLLADNRIIKDINKIPKWCPLPDVKPVTAYMVAERKKYAST